MPPTYTRDRWILALLLEGEGKQRYNKPVVGRTRLIKELFLLKKTFGLRDMEYEFIPYWYGPFCPEIYADLESLKFRSAVQSSETPQGESIGLTPAGVTLAQASIQGIAPETIRRIKECKERFNSLPLDELVAYVYERWPEFTSRALKSPTSVLAELRKQARRSRITDRDIDEAVAAYRAHGAAIE